MHTEEPVDSSLSEPMSLFAVTAPGLEALAAAELQGLGIASVAEPGGVGWSGGWDGIHAANLWLRTVSRVVVRAGEFRARSFIELERHARRIPWERWVAPGAAVELRVTCRKSRLYHEGAVAQRIREAIAHRVGPVEAAPPRSADAEAEGAEAQLFVVRFLHDRCTVSADSSGALLHQRGYRQALARAPLRETLAAAILLGSGWRGDTPLLDPMCGSGTLPIEAALIARRIAPGLAGSPERAPRTFAFQRWPGFEPGPWQEAVERARALALEAAPVPIHGSDRDRGAIEAATANAARAGVSADLRLEAAPLSTAPLPEGRGWVAVNPPYGVRVGDVRPLRNLYAALGAVLRERMPGWTLAILSAERELEGQIGIPLEEVLRTSNGGIPVRLLRGRAEAGE